MQPLIIFAKILANLRKNKQNLLYASISKSTEQTIIDKTFILTFSSEAIYEEVIKENNKKILENYLKNVDNNLEIGFTLKEQKTNEFNIEDYVKKEFGLLLKIKKKGD